MKLSRLRYSLLLALYYTVAPIAMAINMPCDNIRKITDSGERFFVELRGNFDFTFDRYHGIVTLGEFSTCQTESGQGVASYECKKDIAGDNEEMAKQAWESAKSDLTVCLGKDLKVRPSRIERRAFFMLISTGTSITVGYRRSVSSLRGVHYPVTITFTEVDLSIPIGEQP